MPTSAEIVVVKTNLQNIINFFSDIYSEGLKLIPSDNSLSLENCMDIYANSLDSNDSMAAKYVAALIVGFKTITPNSFKNQLTTVDITFQTIYNETASRLDSFYNNIEQFWFNTCTGIINNQDGFYILSVSLCELFNNSFPSKSSEEYSFLFASAMKKFEATLNFFLKK